MCMLEIVAFSQKACIDFYSRQCIISGLHSENKRITFFQNHDGK